MIGQMFVQIYTDPACSRMHAHFAAAYIGASGEDRKPMGRETVGGRTIAAFA
jgi:hypothetical protein